MANEALDKFVKDNQQFIKINDGDTFKGVYAGYKVYPNRFSPGKETVGYFFITVDSDGDKSEKAIPWECGRVDVAIIMKKFKEGDCILITRTGSGMKDTKYKIDETTPF